MLEKPNGFAEFHGGIWRTDSRGFHYGGFGGLDRLCSVSPDSGERSRPPERGTARRDTWQDREPLLGGKMSAIARWFGLDLRASNKATANEVSAIEGTLDDMIATFRGDA